MAQDNLEAAQQLRATRNFRSAVSRAYYAIYCQLAPIAVGANLVRQGWNNPGHEQLRLAVRSLRFEFLERKAILQAVNRAAKTRVSADYRPGHAITEAEARRTLSDAMLVMRFVKSNGGIG